MTANAIKALTNEQIATYLEAPILLGGQTAHQARCWLDEAITRIERGVTKTDPAAKGFPAAAKHSRDRPCAQ